MLKQQKIFFDFLRFCIGSAKDIPSSLKEADWKELYRIAQKQCLVGILFDGILMLPPAEVGMSKDLLLQWMLQCQMLEKANVRLNDAVIQVSEWFRKKEFRTCILKGQGNALMYPNPYSRTPGDIDIWVEGGDKRGISFVRSISPHEKAFREQKKRMVLGNSYIVHIHIDEESYRIVASAKIERYLNEDHPHYKHGDEVGLLIWQKTDLGFKVIIDNQYPGLLYQDQIFQYIHTGDKMKGYIGRVRPDGKIDVTLQKTGIQQTADFAETLYQYLLDNDGECNLGDKSEADDIYERFHVSKKVYKRAVGDLYKKRLITVSPMSIRLAE